MTHCLMYVMIKYTPMQSQAPNKESEEMPVTSGLRQRCAKMCEHLSIRGCTDVCAIMRNSAQCPKDDAWNSEIPFTSPAYSQCQNKCHDRKVTDFEQCGADCEFFYVSPCMSSKEEYIGQCENTCMSDWSNALCQVECTNYLLPQCVKTLKSNDGSNQLMDTTKCVMACQGLSKDLSGTMHADNAPLTLNVLQDYLTDGCTRACNSSHTPVTPESVCRDIFSGPLLIAPTPRSLPPG